MAVRNESVRLTLDDAGFTTGMAKAAAAAALLDRQLNSLDGKHVDTSTSADKASKSVEGLADETRGLSGDTEVLGEKTDKTTKKVKEYTLETAVAEEKARRFRKALQDQAKASLDAADGINATVGPTKDANREFDKGEASIDRYSGRLALLGQAVAVFGPGLVPITTSLIPVLSAATAGLGAAAGALGVTLLAANGLEDGLKALNEYQLEPTAANAAKLKEEFDKLGPSGVEFVRFLDDLEPTFKDLQFTARDGLFPGVQDGITALLGRLPEVKTLVSDLSTTLGDLARDTGEALASDRYQAFFNYLDAEAGPTLREFGQVAGNIFETVANLLVSLDPATDDFMSGLVDKTADLAKWSRDLDDNQGFQSLLDYIRETGPQVLDFVGQLIVAFADIGAAAAPLGGPVLESLTAILKVISAVAESDLGTPIFTAIAALSIYNRTLAATAALQKTAFGQAAAGQAVARGSIGGMLGAQFAGATTATKNLTSGIGTLRSNIGPLAGGFARAAGPIAAFGLATSGAADSTGLANTATLALLGTVGGPWGAALGAAVGALKDASAANNDFEASIDGVKAAIDAGTYTQAADGLDEATAKFEDFRDRMDPGAWELPAASDVLPIIKNNFEGLFGDSDVDEMRKALDAQREALEVQRKERDLRREINSMQTGEGLSLSEALVGPLGKSAEAFDLATASAKDFSAALADVQKFADKRAALRAYRDSIDAASDALKENGQTLNINTEAGRANQAALDAIATNAQLVAEKLKGVDRADFLKGARDDFIDAAVDLGRTRDQARDLAEQFGLLDQQKARPEVELKDDPFLNALGMSKGKLKDLDNDKASPFADLLTGPLEAGVAHAKSELNTLPRSVTVTINAAAANVAATIASVRNQVSSALGHHADGGYITGPGGPRDDKIPAMLSNGEFVVNAAATRQHLPLLHQINARRFADGGLVEDGPEPKTPAQRAAAAKAAREKAEDKRKERLEREHQRRLDALNKALDKNTSRLDKLSDQRQQVIDSVRSNFLSDPFEMATQGIWDRGTRTDPLGNVQADIRDVRRYDDLIGRLKRRGLDGKALGEVDTLEDAEALAARGKGYLRRYERAYEQRNRLSTQAGRTLAQGVGPTRQDIAEIRGEVKGLRDDIRAENKRNRAAMKKNSDDNADRTGKHINGAARDGRRRQQK